MQMLLELQLLFSPRTTQKIVISTEAPHGLIARRAVERPPYFAFAVSVASSPNFESKLKQH
jgi:hypothetical protein